MNETNNSNNNNARPARKNRSTFSSSAPRPRSARPQQQRPARPGAAGARAHGGRPTGNKPDGNRPAGSNNRPGGGRRGPGGQGGPKRGKRRNNRNNQRRRSMTNPALTHRMTETDEKSAVLPEVTSEDTVRIIPLSGVEQIGRNMTVVETKDDIIIFDAGFEFVSEESNAPGVNYILPNTQYLEERKHKIRALVVTHGHLDHIGGIPFIIERIGNPPIYTQYLTSLMIKKRQEEFPHMDPLDINVVKEGESFTVGSTTLKTFPVTHSIPDAMGVSVQTKHGNVVITGDIKITHEDDKPVEAEAKVWQEVGRDNNICLVAESTNAEQEGWSKPEGMVYHSLEEIIKNATGRLVIGTFGSQFDRLITIIGLCEKYGKVVVTEGRSIKVSIDIAITAEMLKVKPGVIVSATEADKYPSDRVVILSTGAQGEEFAALMRMATNQHKFITLNERDTIVLSSSVIPGNEVSVQKLRDNLFRRNVRVVNFRTASVHSSGHGNLGELIWVQQTVKPRFLVPVHGHHSMLKTHKYASIDNGFPANNIVVPDNGTLIDITNGTELKVHKQKAPSSIMYVDGFTVGEKQEVVLRDRLSLANDGMFVIIATVNTKTGKLRKSPDIISRGFIYLRENQQLLSEARMLIKKTVENETANMNPIDLDLVKDNLTDVVSGFLLQRTQKTPMVIPVLIGV